MCPTIWETMPRWILDQPTRFCLPCQDRTCQECALNKHRTEESVVGQVSIQDILKGDVRLPFTSRASWLAIQSECKDLRHTHAYLAQGTRPSKKLSNVKDVKIYLSVHVATIATLCSFARIHRFPFSSSRRPVKALHISVSHPSVINVNLPLHDTSLS